MLTPFSFSRDSSINDTGHQVYGLSWLYLVLMVSISSDFCQYLMLSFSTKRGKLCDVVKCFFFQWDAPFYNQGTHELLFICFLLCS